MPRADMTSHGRDLELLEGKYVYRYILKTLLVLPRQGI